MFRRSPFKDAEVNPEPPRLDFQDRVGLAIAFLWFYHRVIVGAILLAGLGFWIYQTAKVANLQKPKLDELPSASLEFVPEKESTVAPASKPTPEAADDQSANDQPSEDQPNPVTKRSPSDLDRLIETGPVSELIKESLDIRKKIGKNNSIIDFMLCSRRAKISRRLLEKELTPSQREFGMVSYIESISMLDSLNVQGQLNIDGPRAALIEVKDKYANHSNPNVKIKANLAILLAPAYDFLVSGDPELLRKFASEFDQRSDLVINDQHAANRLLNTALLVNDKVGTELLTWPVALSVLESFEKTTSPNVKKMAASIRERLYFGKLDLDTLVDRIKDADSRSSADVQKLFEALAVNPDSRPEIYTTAVAVIQQYQALDRQEVVEELVERLRETCATMTDDPQQQEVLASIAELEKR